MYKNYNTLRVYIRVLLEKGSSISSISFLFFSSTTHSSWTSSFLETRGLFSRPFVSRPLKKGRMLWKRLLLLVLKESAVFWGNKSMFSFFSIYKISWGRTRWAAEVITVEATEAGWWCTPMPLCHQYLTYPLLTKSLIMIRPNENR